MPSSVRTPPSRLVAAFLATLVFALGLLAHLPEVHARLHVDHDATACAHDDSGHFPSADSLASDHEAGCAVTLFSQGLPLALSAPRALPPFPAPELARLSAPLAILPPAPARLHPPAHAPPAALV